MATIHTKAIRSDLIIINMFLYWHSQLATIKWFERHCSPFHQACSLWAASFHPSPLPHPLLLQHEQLPRSLKIPLLPLHFAWLCKLQVMVTSRVHNAMSTVFCPFTCSIKLQQAYSWMHNVRHPDLSSQHTSQPTKIIPLIILPLHVLCGSRLHGHLHNKIIFERIQEGLCNYWNMRFVSSVDVARIGVLNVTGLFVYKASKSLRLTAFYKWREQKCCINWTSIPIYFKS